MDRIARPPPATGALSPVSSDWSNRLVPESDLAIGGQPLARRNAHHHAGHQIARGQPFQLAVGRDHHRPRRRLPQQRIDPGARAVAHRRIERAARQQEQQQHQRAIEPGVVAAGHGLIEAERGGQGDADRDRHVHIGAPVLQRAPGRGEERLPGIGDGRNADQRREPVEQLARRALRARPDADRQQHHIHAGKARHRQRREQRLDGRGGRRQFLGRAAGWQSRPASSAATSSGTVSAGSWSTRTCRADRLTRAEATPAAPASARSTLPMQPAQCMPGTTSTVSLSVIGGNAGGRGHRTSSSLRQVWPAACDFEPQPASGPAGSAAPRRSGPRASGAKASARSGTRPSGWRAIADSVAHLRARPTALTASRPSRLARYRSLPAQRLLGCRLVQPAVEILAGDIGVLDHHPAKGAAGQPRHQQVDRHHHAEEGDEDRRHVPAGETAPVIRSFLPGRRTAPGGRRCRLPGRARAG